MAVKFKISETMRGLHHFVDSSYGTSDERPLYFNIIWGQSLPAFFSPNKPTFFVARAEGEIYVEGLTPYPVPTQGSLSISYFQRQELQYDLSFDLDGSTYKFVGIKRDVELWRPWLLPKTHTTCYGELKKAGGPILSRSVLHFPLDVFSVLRFAGSLRLTL